MCPGFRDTRRFPDFDSVWVLVLGVIGREPFVEVRKMYETGVASLICASDASNFVIAPDCACGESGLEGRVFGLYVGLTKGSVKVRTFASVPSNILSPGAANAKHHCVIGA